VKHHQHVIVKGRVMHDLEQAKRRNRKVYITDVAIDKVPYIAYNGFTEEQNKIMQELAKDVLLLSKEENESNEVAITCDLGAEDPLKNFGVTLGTEHEVDILADTFSNHIIVSQKSVAVVVLHNHPSTQTFSLQDIQFFIQYPMIEVIVVVSNQGTVHYLKRDKEYDYKQAFQLFRECIEDLNQNSPVIEQYLASLSFLAKCSEVGLYYR
jgi:proteasome lid subunit RPN8/RPN11